MSLIRSIEPNVSPPHLAIRPAAYGAADLDASAVSLIRSHLERVLRSGAFLRSIRMQRFLRYAVEQTLSGFSDSLKESSIARAVFDKDEFFDPRLDPIVRIEAGRLRTKLRQYYAEEGAADSLRIVFRKRSYAPSFQFKDSPVSGRSLSDSEGCPLAIAILPFIDLNPARNRDRFCAALTEELINLANRMTGLQVVARTSVLSFAENMPDVRRIGKELNVDVLLEGSVQRDGGKARISTALVDARNGYRLWTNVYDTRTNGGFDMQQRIAQEILNYMNGKLQDLHNFSDCESAL